MDEGITPKEFYDKYIGIDLDNDYIEIYSFKDDKYKYKQVADEVVTKAQRDEIIAEWQEELKK